MEDVLKSDKDKSSKIYKNVDWFCNEVVKLENKKACYFEKTRKDVIITKEDEEDFNIKICRFCKKKSGKVKDHCHLTSKSRGPAHSTCIINVTQYKIYFIPFLFHNFSNYDFHMSFKKLVDKKNDKLKSDIIPKTNEVIISVTYDCITFIDSYRFLSSSSHSVVRALVNDNHKTLKSLKEEIVDNDEVLNIVNEIGEDRTIEDLKKDYPKEIEKLEEALLNYIGKNDLKFLKTEVPRNGNIFLKN